MSEGDLPARRDRRLPARPAPPAPRTTAPAPLTGARLAMLFLVAVVIAQGGLLVWWWMTAPGGWLQPAPTTAAITITSDPPGAAVLIDGTPAGATPLVVNVAAGSHQLQVGVEQRAWTQVLAVQAGVPASVHVVRPAPELPVPPPPVGALRVSTDPAGLVVTVDGQPQGRSPVELRDLPAGEHHVEVAGSGSVIRRTVSVEAGGVSSVMITAPVAGIPSGWLTVTAPVSVQIEENGTLIGTSDTPRLLLPVGRHDLTLFNDTFGYRVRRTVNVTAGQGGTLALEPVNGSLSVNAQPWGEVWVDGRRLGETPIANVPLPIGYHELLVRHPQLGERRRTVAVGAGGPTRIGIDMRP